MTGFTVEFQFDIGDIVYARDAAHDEASTPMPMCIIERIAQECMGGVQRLYKTSRTDKLLPEVCLTNERPPYQRVDSDRIAEQAELRATIRKAERDAGGWSWSEAMPSKAVEADSEATP